MNDFAKITGADPINPVDITTMSPEQHERLLDGLRERRMRAQRFYTEQEEERKRVDDERAAEQLGKQLAILAKDLVAMEKKEQKVQERINKIRALRLQLGMEAQ